MTSALLRRLLAPALLLGCAEEVPAPSPAVPQPVPAVLPASVPMDQYLATAAQVECAAIFRCRASGDAAGLRLLFGTFERCVANADELAGEAERARWRALVAAGTSRYDGAAARRCLEALRGEFCGARPPEACLAVFGGTVPPGGPCRRHDDCADDGWCRTEEPGGGAACPGVCARRAPLGASCQSGTAECSQRGARGVVHCAFVRSLDGTPDPFRCEDSDVATAAEGPFARAGEVCADSRGAAPIMRRCAPDLDCVTRVRDVSSYGECVGPQPLGAPCERYCQGDALCAVDATFTRRCQPLVVRGREGERCVQGNDGAELCNVLLGLDCVAGRCQRVGTGEAGSVCFTARFGVDSCRAGLVCHGATQTCRPRAAVGAPCGSPDECESRRCASDGTGPARCVPDAGCGG